MQRATKKWRTTCAIAVAGTALGLMPLMYVTASAGPDDNSGAINNSYNPSAQNLTLPPGIEQKSLDDAGGIKSTLVGLTQRGVTKDSYNSFFGSFLAELAKHDKERAQEFKGVDQSHLDSMIGQIQNQWRAKYNQDFDISDKNLVFNDQFTIVEGQVTDPALAMNNWPVQACTNQSLTASSTYNSAQNAAPPNDPTLKNAGQASTPQNNAPLSNNTAQNNSAQSDVSQSNASQNNAPSNDATLKDAGQTSTPQNNAPLSSNAPDQTQLSQGQEVAIVRYPAGDGLPDINVSLIHHTMTGWYVSVPYSRNGREIYNNLCAHLDYIANHPDQWPSDVNDGYRMVARHVAASVYGVPAPGGTNAQANGL